MTEREYLQRQIILIDERGATNESKARCGECACLITDDGEPFYCAIRDLYTFRSKDDAACSDYVRETRNDNESQAERGRILV